MFPINQPGGAVSCPSLVLRVADPGGIDEEPPVLCVLEERVVDPRLGGLGLGDDRRQVVGDEDREDAPEERPGGIETGDHVARRLAEGQPDVHVPGPHRHHDEGVDDPASLGVGIEDDPHPPEVTLELLARIAVSTASSMSSRVAN